MKSISKITKALFWAWLIVPLIFTIASAADFNADTKPDIFWRNTSTGTNAVWYMDGVNFTGAVGYPPAVADQNWSTPGGYATRCPNIAGAWKFTLTGSVNLLMAGQASTEPVSDGGSATITQNGCHVIWTDPTNNETISAMLVGISIYFSESLVWSELGSVPGFTITQADDSWSGTISPDKRMITVNGGGPGSGFYEGWWFSGNVSGTMTLTRMP